MPKTQYAKNLTGTEANDVLKLLLHENPKIAAAVEELSRKVLGQVSDEHIAKRVHSGLVAANNIENLVGKSGATRSGYVQPTQAAIEICDAVVNPFLNDMKRRLAMGDVEGAIRTCQGIVWGLYQTQGIGSGGVLEWAGGDEWLGTNADWAIDVCFEEAKKLKIKVNRIRFEEGHLKMMPGWADWLTKKF